MKDRQTQLRKHVAEFRDQKRDLQSQKDTLTQGRENIWLHLYTIEVHYKISHGLAPTNLFRTVYYRNSHGLTPTTLTDILHCLVFFFKSGSLFIPLSEIGLLYKKRQKLRDDFRTAQSDYMMATNQMSQRETEERERESQRRDLERTARRRRQ